MKRIISALTVLALTGCGTFGHTAYRISQTAAGCDFTAEDGKEFKGRSISFDGKSCTLVMKEEESKAFKGQAIGAKTLTVFPVTGLSDIVK